MLHPIYRMAAVTSIVALAVWGSLLWQICPRDGRRPLIIALLLIGCFMSPAAFFGLRRPLLIGPLEPILVQPEWNFGGRAVVRNVVRLSFAPLTEEPCGACHKWHWVTLKNLAPSTRNESTAKS